MAPNELDLAATYFMRRLSIARQANVPASMQFDLARSPLPDDELEDAVDQFRDSPHQRDGWGFAPIFQEMLSREPEKIPVNDLKKLQENMVAQGYLPPDFQPTGVWDAVSQSGLRRLDRDAREEQMRGHHLGAAPVEAGLRLITNTLPSRVWQGLVGTAKGLVQQTPETLERVGALGGAAGGAAIGASIGSVIPGAGTLAGAGVGAVVGGVGGFLADLFGSDEGEEDQGALGGLLDALTPFQEYGANPRAFWEDLGYVASASSIVGGVGMAAKGFTGAVAGARATGSSLLAKAGPAEPGWMTRITAAASKPVLGSNRIERMVDFVKASGLNAQMSRPAFQAANKFYSGLAAGQTGARLAAGLQSGEDVTTIEKAIQETDPLAGYVDMVGILLYPEQLLPIKAKQVANTATKLMGNTDMLPFAHVVQSESLKLSQMGQGKSLSLRESVERAKQTLGATEFEQAVNSTWLRYQFGIDYKAAVKVDELSRQTPGVAAEGTFASAKYDTVAKLHREAEAGAGDVLAREVLGYSFQEPAAFEAWLRDKSFDSLPGYVKAEKLVHRVRADIRAGKVDVSGQVKGFIADAEAGWQRLKTSRMVKGLDDQAAEIQAQIAKATDPAAVTAMEAEVVQLKAAAKELRRNMPKADGPPRDLENLIIVPERLDTPTRADLEGFSREYVRLRDEIVKGSKAGVWTQVADARMRLTEFLDDLAYRGILPRPLVEKTLKTERPSLKGIVDHLAKKARYSASDIKLPDSVMSELRALGYKPVVTSGDVVMTSDVVKLGEVMGAGDYTRRAALFETLGFSPRWRSDDSLFKLRASNELAELDAVMASKGASIKLSGKDVRDKLYDELSKISHASVTWGPISMVKGKRPHLPRIDVRDLTPEDITLVFDKVPGWTDELSIEVFGALRRGAAYGAEVKMLAPMDTMRALGRGMRLNGLPGFSDVIRGLHVDNPNTLTLAGATAGGVLGATSGDEGLEDIARGAIGGAVVGRIGAAAAKRSYGYLPDKLSRMNTALRYTFSFTFDAGRYSEQNLIAMTKYGLPAMLNPKKHIKARIWPTPYGSEVTGDEAWRHTVQFWDELNGTPGFFKNIEDTDRRVYQAGLLGFKPRDWEAAQAFQLYQRGWSREKIREAVTQIGRYGLGRTAAEKSANFIFFPFSFSKKLLTTLGDFILQAPARGLLLHEGMRRYHESTLDEGFHTLIEKHAPLLEQLANVNNLYYGLSPGRFFLEGITDKRTNVGRVMQALTSVIVPSGAATPLSQAAGSFGDWTINAFIPIVVTGESLDRAGGVEGLQDVITRYIPLVRDTQRYVEAISEQVVALAEGAAPDYQFQSYVDGRRQVKADLEPIATSLGYASTDGLLQSDIGLAFQPQVEAAYQELQEQYPTGARLASQFEDRSTEDARALMQLVDKPNRSPAEDRIVNLFEEIERWKLVVDVTGLDSQVSNAILGRKVREIGTRYAGDRRFVELWERFLAWQFGPLRRING